MKYTREQIEAMIECGDASYNQMLEFVRQLLEENDALLEDAARWKTFSENANEDWHDEMVNEMFYIAINPNRMNELVDAARKKG